MCLPANVANSALHQASQVVVAAHGVSQVVVAAEEAHGLSQVVVAADGRRFPG